CFSLLSLVAIAACESRPDLLVSRQFLSNYLPINHEIPLVLSAVNIGKEIAHDVTLSLFRKAYTNATHTAPFTVRGSLSVKYPKVRPGETVQHVIRVTLNRDVGREMSQSDQQAYMSIAGAPARVIYHGKHGQTYAGTSVVTSDKIPQVVTESTAQKYTGTNGWYWMVFSAMMSVTIVIPLLTVCSFKWKYDEEKRRKTKKVSSDEDETSSENDGSKTKDSAPKQVYTASQVVKKKTRRE
ncbi:hypothetical protein PMAYCL1PPCAC_23363, partial [Pristionchus mayeri]